MGHDRWSDWDIDYTVGESKPVKVDHGWYRGEHCNFIPNKANLEEPDAIDDYILKGWLPDEPFITKKTRVTAFGSCFARHITAYLQEHGYNMSLSKEKWNNINAFTSGVNTSFAFRQKFEWALEDAVFEEDLWRTGDSKVIERTAELKEQSRELFETTEVFILTLGLSEVWYSKDSGQVYWRGVPKSLYSPEKHGFRVSTVEENVSNLNRVLDLIEKHNPTAKVILTLSPVPLIATFRPVSCVTANSVSKSILRVAIDEVVRAGRENVYYWPSYEIIKEFFVDAYREDRRHVTDEALDVVMGKFSQYYLKEEEDEGTA